LHVKGNALTRKGISKKFKERSFIAKERPKRRQQADTKPKPPDA